MLKTIGIKDFLNRGAIVSLPNKNILLGWGKSNLYKRPPLVEIPSFYFSDFFLNTLTPWHVFENNLEISREEFIDFLQPECQPLLSRSWHNPYKAFFRDTIADIQKRIYEHELQKAVPFIYEISPTTMTSNQLAVSLIQAGQIMHKYPLNLYGIWNKNEGMLGLSPEILFSLDQINNKWKLQSHALAGTKASSDKNFSMKTDPKTLNEHNLVREGIVSALSDLGSITIGPLEELVLPTLKHLKTIIHLDMDTPPDILSILSRLHPTPALGAFPRKEGMEWLRYYQTFIDRKLFGSPVGYRHALDHSTNFYVAIRNVQWTSEEMRIGAGCGIVMGSQFEKEWLEVNLKIKSIKEALAL